MATKATVELIEEDAQMDQVEQKSKEPEEAKPGEQALTTEQTLSTEESEFFKDLERRIEDDKARNEAMTFWQKYSSYIWVAIITSFIIFVLVILVLLLRKT